MNRIINLKFMAFLISLIYIVGLKSSLATEPVIADYSASSVFLSSSAKPNVLIILDNSGSMNLNAYGKAGPWYGEPVRDDFIDTANLSYIGWIVDEPFAGEPQNSIEVRVANFQDDATEYESDGTTNVASYNLELGRDNGGHDKIVGLRFKGVQIPRAATVTKAYIEFSTQETYAAGDQDTLMLTIHGEDVNDAKRFESSAGKISSRSKTAASVAWFLDPGIEPWDTVGDKHRTPELKNIVQEIVDRKGWSSGSPMAFIISKAASSTKPGRSATAYDLGPSNSPLLHVEIERTDATRYYGYFNPDYFYFYNSNRFDHKYRKLQYSGDPSMTGYWEVEDLNGNQVNPTDAMIVNEGLWDGNWLNWLAMRRIDVLRKVLMGGLATSRTGGGNQVNMGESSTKYVFIKQFDSTAGSAARPYDGNYYYAVRGDRIYVIDGSSTSLNTNLSDVVTGQSVASATIADYNIHVQKNVNYEAADFHNYDSGQNLAGVLQKIGDKVRWGVEFFYEGTGANKSDGYIAAEMGANMTSIVNDLQNTQGNTWTPLAESYYTAMQYFKQQAPDGSLDYKTSGFPCTTDAQDPWYNGTEFVPCAKSFVILLTDGNSTMDTKIPDAYKDYDADGNDAADLSCYGSDYLDDIALYAHTTDLRSSTVGKTDLDGDQILNLYTIYAFGDVDDARQLLKDAAKNGGFIDRNGNKQPDLDDEWDADGDGLPDTYYEASNGYLFEQSLLDAVTDIIKKAASGTAASVLSTNTEGEGTMIQAYYRASVTSGLDEARWLGYLQALWVDEYGNLREDSDGDAALDITQDQIIKYFSDASTGDTKVKKYMVDSATPYPNTDDANCLNGGTCLEAVLDEIDSIFEAGSLLAARDPDQRRIFTYIDINNDTVVDENTDNGFDTSGEVITFDTTVTSEIQPYLDVADNSAWSYLGSTHAERASNLIDFIRGKDAADLIGTVNTRNRTLNGVTWKLGDIVHSTPATVAKPSENYHIIYKDIVHVQGVIEFSPN